MVIDKQERDKVLLGAAVALTAALGLAGLRRDQQICGKVDAYRKARASAHPTGLIPPPQWRQRGIRRGVRILALLLSVSMSPEQGVIDHQHDNRSDHGDDHAVEIEAGDAACAHCSEDEAPDDRPDNAEDNVEKETLTRSVYDLASDEPRDKSQKNPSENRHHTPAHI